jgi:ribosomal-protein-alanine N-acetyltransferase
VSAQPGNTTPVIRTMRVADLDAVSAIELDSYDFPWERGIFSDCLMAGYQGVVLDGGDEIIGYAIISTAAAEGHILNLCVAEGWQRLGYGRQLLDYMLDHAWNKRIARLFLEVRPSNVAAISLYESTGFKRLGVRKSYYRADDGREDALVLMREFGMADDDTDSSSNY